MLVFIFVKFCVRSNAVNLLRHLHGINLKEVLGKGKVFYGQEPPSGSGESTTTECGFNCQLLAVRGGK